MIRRGLGMLALFLLCCSSESDGARGGVDGPDDADGGPIPMMPGTSDGSTAAQATYETLPPLAGGVRQEHAVVALRGRVCVIGGFAPGITDSVECYDRDARSWSPIAPLPVPMHHANAAVVDDRIYVLGYLSDILFTATGASYVYDPDADGWADVTPMPIGRERGSGGAVVLGTEIHVLGGFRSGTVAEVDIYDTATDSWRLGPDLPEPREHLCAGTVGDLVVIAGGRAGGIGAHTDVVLALESGANNWEERAPMPTSRGGAAGATLAGRFHVFGGEGNLDDPSGVYADAEAYDPIEDRWYVLPPMPVPRHGFGAVTLEGRIYLPGGATQQAFGAVDEVEAFTYE
jgi:N-acetylneuraminic acid mutarotase